MRREILEVMAEEIAGRPVDALASFSTWDDGRRRLDGMAKGRRWDLDREQREWERDNAADLARFVARRNWQRWMDAHPERAKEAARGWVRKNWAQLLVYRARWAETHREKEREYDRRQRANMKADARRLALYRARQERHREKKRQRAKERYRANLVVSRERARLHSGKYYREHREEILARRRGQGAPRRRCGLCGDLGHNRRGCRRVEAA